MIRDLWAVLRGAGIALDEAEAAWLGNDSGQTISVWAAMEARHGSAAAHLVCLALWLVQRNHCCDQLCDVPMETQNDLRAAVLLILFAPIALVIGAFRKIIGA